jgi:hypothetical protein
VCSAKGEHRWRLTKDRVKGEKNTGKGDGKSLPQILFWITPFPLYQKNCPINGTFLINFWNFIRELRQNYDFA